MREYKMPNLGKFKRVEQYEGVANQFLIYFEKGEVLQSYRSTIAVIVYGGGTYIGQDYKYRNTTGKYRDKYLCEDLKDTERSIEEGTYKMLSI